MSDLIFIGLDFETTGLSHEASAPIEIGIATEDGLMYDSLIGGWKWENEPNDYEERQYEWSNEAEEIHGITKGDLSRAPSVFKADTFCTSFIRRCVGIEPKKIIAVGWNIAAFDFPFLREYLPQTANSMSYRSVDLNALLFGITQAGTLLDNRGRPWTYYSLKSFVKDQAAEYISMELDRAEAWHSAGYDALASIYAYDALLSVMRGTIGGIN